jgi:hypothetical protein
LSGKKTINPSFCEKLANQQFMKAEVKFSKEITYRRTRKKNIVGNAPLLRDEKFLISNVDVMLLFSSHLYPYELNISMYKAIS